MRLLFATHNYPRFPDDPAGAFVRRLATGAVEAGHQARVVAPHAPGLPTRVVEGGVEVVRFHYAPASMERVAYRGDLHHTSRLPLLTLLGIPAFLAAFRHVLRRECRAFAPDVVHAHWWLPAGMLAARLGRPYIVTLHGSDARLLDRSVLLRSLARRVLGGAESVTTVSDFLGGDLARALPGLRAPIVTARMPLDVERFARPASAMREQPPLILYAGNLLASKGIDVLLDAFALLRSRGVRCRLRILGEGPDEQRLRMHARALGVDADVVWSRFVGQEQIASEYAASTVVVLPTRGDAEGLGLVLAEALLAGAAVVGTPAGGIPEVVRHEETGLIARDGDPTDLANAIARLLADPELRHRLQSRGEALVRERFSATGAIARFLTLYESAARNQALD